MSDGRRTLLGWWLFITLLLGFAVGAFFTLPHVRPDEWVPWVVFVGVLTAAWLALGVYQLVAARRP